MIIWEISTTDGETTSYRFYVMKGEASKAKRAFKKEKVDCDGPEKVKVSNREDLIELILKIQGGAAPVAKDEDDEEANEFL